MMPAIDLKWWVSKNIHKQSFEVFAHIPAGFKQLACRVETITLTAIPAEDQQDGALEQSTFALTKESCQSLMDELWSVGVRPSNGGGNLGELEAVKAHLKDMRDLTFSFMGLKK